MIECSDKNIWYKKRRKGKLKKFFVFFLIVLIIAFIFFYYKFFISKQIFAINQDYVNKYSIESVNVAILSVLEDGLGYNDLINVEKNAQGDIVLLNANSYKINQVSRTIEKVSAENIDVKLSGGTPVPSLAFSGIGAISGYGRPIYLKTATISSVWCEFESKFTSAGINQTIHSIYVNVNLAVSINVPLHSKIENYSTRVLLTETVLVGKVPEFYFNGKLLA